MLLPSFSSRVYGKVFTMKQSPCASFACKNRSVGQKTLIKPDLNRGDLNDRLRQEPLPILSNIANKTPRKA